MIELTTGNPPRKISILAEDILIVDDVSNLGGTRTWEHSSIVFKDGRGTCMSVNEDYEEVVRLWKIGVED